MPSGLCWSMVQVADQEDSRENHNRQAGEAREVGHHQDVDGASESEAECKRQEGARDRKLRRDAKRHRERIGENDEPDRFRDVRHVKGDEPRQPQAREPSCDAREALGIERRWQQRYRLVGRIDLRAGEVLDVGDRLKEIARELVDFLQVTAIEEERGPAGTAKAKPSPCLRGSAAQKSARAPADAPPACVRFRRTGGRAH